MGACLVTKDFHKKYFKTSLYDYDAVIGKYQDHFGRERVQTIFFEGMKKNPDEFLRQLLSFVNIDYKACGNDLGNLWKNFSPSEADVYITLLINRLFFPLTVIFPFNILFKAREKTSIYFAKIMELMHLKWIFRKDLCVDANGPVQIKKRYSASNDKLFDLLEIPRDKYDYP